MSCALCQRLDALRKFKDGEIAVLIATDLAARGLDIERVKTVGVSMSHLIMSLIVMPGFCYNVVLVPYIP